ncbi:MAG: HlyD family type I secretion periplasmic adaptor subunit [Pseudomonadota bacterium]
MKALANKQEISNVIAHDVSPLTVDTDAGRWSKFGWLIVLLGVGGFLLWASFAPLDKGVPLSGTVAKESNRKAIQHQTGGTVSEILVKEGDVVKAGQILVRMNPILASSNAEASRIQWMTARAAEARLLAERDGKSALVFPADLLAQNKDVRMATVIEVQKELFNSRQQSIHSELSAVDENIAGLKIQIEAVRASRESKKVQLDILKEQVGNLRDLAKDGYIARSRLLEVERQLAQVTGAIAEDTGNIGRTERQVSEYTLRRTQRAQDYQKEVRTQLADAQREADSLRNRVKAQDYEVANTDVKAPVDGIVVGINVFTNGGVIGPGFRIMDLVPVNDAMVVEGQLAVNLIDKVHTDLPVELNFSAFNTNRTPHIPGIVTQVGADRMVDEKTGTPYYRVKVKVTSEGLALVARKHLEIRPGMPVDLFIKTGERSMMSYLLKPVFDRAKSSMAEE